MELGKLNANPWELDAEFKARTAKERKTLDAAQDAEIAEWKVSLASEQGANATDLRTRLEKAERDLAGKTYTVKGQALRVVYGAFDRDRKTWPVTVDSTDQSLPYSAVFSHDLSKASDLRTAYTAVDTALKAGALAGEMDYGISRIPGRDRSFATVKEVQVTVSSFEIGKYEITQALYRKVMVDNPSRTTGDSLRPVEQVSWYVAVAWSFGNSDGITHTVGTKTENELGLYDMSGNVWEWCQDWYGECPIGAQTDPTGASSGSGPVRRGRQLVRRRRLRAGHESARHQPGQSIQQHRLPRRSAPAILLTDQSRGFTMKSKSCSIFLSKV